MRLRSARKASHERCRTRGDRPTDEGLLGEAPRERLKGDEDQVASFSDSMRIIRWLSRVVGHTVIHARKGLRLETARTESGGAARYIRWCAGPPYRGCSRRSFSNVPSQAAPPGMTSRAVSLPSLIRYVTRFWF